MQHDLHLLQLWHLLVLEWQRFVDNDFLSVSVSLSTSSTSIGVSLSFGFTGWRTQSPPEMRFVGALATLMIVILAVFMGTAVLAAS
jgi:hypothetical protein